LVLEKDKIKFSPLYDEEEECIEIKNLDDLFKLTDPEVRRRAKGRSNNDDIK
jgi:hypothetical protein